MGSAGAYRAPPASRLLRPLVTMKTFELSRPTFAFIVATRAALGAGIGLLVSTRFSDSRRRALGVTLVSIGAATTIPAAIALLRARRNSMAALPG
jgi:hypothetical protein